MSMIMDFAISKEKEKELFDFVINECMYQIYLPFPINHHYNYCVGDPIDLETYIIVSGWYNLLECFRPVSKNDEQYEECKKSYYEYCKKFDLIPEKVNDISVIQTDYKNKDIIFSPEFSIPVIWYQRIGCFLQEDNPQVLACRFYADTSLMERHYYTDVKATYLKLKRWIVKHAVDYEQDGNHKLYIVR